MICILVLASSRKLDCDSWKAKIGLLENGQNEKIEVFPDSSEIYHSLRNWSWAKSAEFLLACSRSNW